MKDYKALPELTRRLGLVHQRVVDLEREGGNPAKIEENRWLRQAYADALRMTLQEFLCDLYTDHVCPQVSREDALNFAKRKYHNRDTPDEMLLGMVLGERKPVPAGSKRYGVIRTFLNSQPGEPNTVYWHGELGWGVPSPEIPPFYSREQAEAFIASIPANFMLRYDVYELVINETAPQSEEP